MWINGNCLKLYFGVGVGIVYFNVCVFYGLWLVFFFDIVVLIILNRRIIVLRVINIVLMELIIFFIFNFCFLRYV